MLEVPILDELLWRLTWDLLETIPVAVGPTNVIACYCWAALLLAEPAYAFSKRAYEVSCYS